MEITIKLNEKETENYKLFKEGKIAFQIGCCELIKIFMYKNMLVLNNFIITDKDEIDRMIISCLLENSYIYDFNSIKVVEFIKNKRLKFKGDIFYYIDDDNIYTKGFKKVSLPIFLVKLIKYWFDSKSNLILKDYVK